MHPRPLEALEVIAFLGLRIVVDDDDSAGNVGRDVGTGNTKSDGRIGSLTFHAELARRVEVCGGGKCAGIILDDLVLHLTGGGDFGHYARCERIDSDGSGDGTHGLGKSDGFDCPIGIILVGFINRDGLRGNRATGD